MYGNPERRCIQSNLSQTNEIPVHSPKHLSLLRLPGAEPRHLQTERDRLSFTHCFSGLHFFPLLRAGNCKGVILEGFIRMCPKAKKSLTFPLKKKDRGSRRTFKAKVSQCCSLVARFPKSNLCFGEYSSPWGPGNVGSRTTSYQNPQMLKSHIKWCDKVALHSCQVPHLQIWRADCKCSDTCHWPLALVIIDSINEEGEGSLLNDGPSMEFGFLNQQMKSCHQIAFSFHYLLARKDVTHIPFVALFPCLTPLPNQQSVQCLLEVRSKDVLKYSGGPKILLKKLTISA